MTIQVGFHPSIQKGYLTGIREAHELGANAIQIWTGNSKSYASKLVPESIYKPVAKYVYENDIFLIAHSPYVLNFARPHPTTALNRYLNDLINITNLGGKGSVLHMGANVADMNQSMEQAYKNFIDNLLWIAERMPDNCFIILENMAGGGTRMACQMKDWAHFWNLVPSKLKEKIKWCIDTAHLYATGEYNISQRTEVLQFKKDFDTHIGWDNVLCVHFNGSRSAFGSHVDNHDDIGSGFIDIRGLKQFAISSKKPLILEVPEAEGFPIQKQLALIREWLTDPLKK